uniref:Glycoprotein hormone beta-5.2 n=1 Tax=Ophionotus victoriae TaxID=667017 RepID=A0A220W0J3_9ECHI|nr:glycoprotein hormone beta-5.2 precursor [Ophionotus victoriae]
MTMPQQILLEWRKTTVLCSVFCIILAACFVCVSSGRSGGSRVASLDCNVRWFLQHEAKKLGCRTQTIGLNACFGRCDTYQVPILEPPYKTSNHDMCSYGAMEYKSVELDDCDVGVNRTYVYVNALSCRCRQCSTYDTHCLGVH